MLDFHCHILPCMDDGADSVKTSIEILEEEEKQGVDTLVLTSHFYPMEEDIDEYLDRREKAYLEILKNYQGKITLLKGAEVYYYRGIANSNEIDKLCVENTDLLLLELPFFKKVDLRELCQLNSKLQVVLAHIERYVDIYSYKEIENLALENIYLQSNAEVFNEKDFSKIRKLLENGYIKFIGSDAHDLKNRKPLLNTARIFIENRYSKEFYQNFVSESKEILGDRKV